MIKKDLLEVLRDKLHCEYISDLRFVSLERVCRCIQDAGYKRTFAFLMFALLKATSKEVQHLYNGDPAIAYFDSLCNNLQQLVETYNDYRQLKEKYGPEFMEMLFDMQELWMSIENIPYTRPTERSFDRMALLAADKSNTADLLDDFDSPVTSEKDVEDKMDGFSISGLEEYEAGTKTNFGPADHAPKHKKVDSVFGRSKGHKMITGG